MSLLWPRLVAVVSVSRWKTDELIWSGPGLPKRLQSKSEHRRRDEGGGGAPKTMANLGSWRVG